MKGWGGGTGCEPRIDVLYQKKKQQRGVGPGRGVEKKMKVWYCTIKNKQNPKKFGGGVGWCSILLFLPSYTMMSATSRHDVGYYCYFTFIHYCCLIKHKYLNRLVITLATRIIWRKESAEEK